MVQNWEEQELLQDGTMTSVYSHKLHQQNDTVLRDPALLNFLSFYHDCARLGFTDSSYFLWIDKGLTKHILLHVQAEDPILLSTQPDQSS